MTTPIDWDLLEEKALEVRERAWAPFSGYRVGAALLTEGDEIIVGCNVENRSFGLAICAERNAVTTAVARGFRQFKALVVVTSSSPPAAPCGLCRETLVEFAAKLPIRLINGKGESRDTDIATLFPEPFVFGPHAQGTEEESPQPKSAGDE